MGVVLAVVLAMLMVPGMAAAQQPGKVYRIGFLGGTPPSAEPGLWSGFEQGMRELGYVNGRDFVLEGRYYGDHVERLPALAAELAQLGVDVILAGGAPAPEVASRTTSTIPIVMAYHADPVAVGLAASLAKPGGNVTGLSVLSVDLVGKQLQLLKEAVPGLATAAFLYDESGPPSVRAAAEAEIAAPSIGLTLQKVGVRTPDDLAQAFSTIGQGAAGALVIRGGSMFFAERARIAQLAEQSRLPSISIWREYAEAGGLMGYGTNMRESFRRAAAYVDKILKGAKPGDLPIEQASTFEFVVNLKTARKLGLEIPPSILAQADQVIE